VGHGWSTIERCNAVNKMLMMQKIKVFLGDERGQVLTEATIVMPLMLLVLIGSTLMLMMSIQRQKCVHAARLVAWSRACAGVGRSESTKKLKDNVFVGPVGRIAQHEAVLAQSQSKVPVDFPGAGFVNMIMTSILGNVEGRYTVQLTSGMLDNKNVPVLRSADHTGDGFMPGGESPDGDWDISSRAMPKLYSVSSSCVWPPVDESWTCGELKEGFKDWLDDMLGVGGVPIISDFVNFIFSGFCPS
jgi:hypothetical protein